MRRIDRQRSLAATAASPPLPRRAPRPWPTAAPRRSTAGPPENTPTWPRAIFVRVGGRRGNRCSQSAGSVLEAGRADLCQHSRIGCRSPRRRLRRKELVPDKADARASCERRSRSASALNAVPSTAPLSPDTPDGRSTATTGTSAAATGDRARPRRRLRAASTARRRTARRPRPSQAAARNRRAVGPAQGIRQPPPAASVPAAGRSRPNSLTVDAGLVEQPRHDIAVAAIVAGPGQHVDRCRAPGSARARRRRPPHRRGASAPMPSNGPAVDRQPVGLAHLVGRQQFMRQAPAPAVAHW